MPKFRRVEAGIPQNIQDQFFPQESVEDDPYAHLRAGAAERTAQIQREGIKFSRTGGPAPVQHEWETVREASRLEQQSFLPEDDEMSNLNAYDVSARGVRRFAQDTQESDIPRLNAADFRYVTMEEGRALMHSGASIWDPNMERVCSDLGNEEMRRLEEVDRRTTAEARRAKHGVWEEERLAACKPKTKVLSRGGAVLRTFNEHEGTTGRFGMQDYDGMLQRESERLESISAQREARAGLKRIAPTRDERHMEWQRRQSEDYARSYQETPSGDWADKIVDSLFSLGAAEGPRVSTSQTSEGQRFRKVAQSPLGQYDPSAPNTNPNYKPTYQSDALADTGKYEAAPSGGGYTNFNASEYGPTSMGMPNSSQYEPRPSAYPDMSFGRSADGFYNENYFPHGLPVQPGAAATGAPLSQYAPPALLKTPPPIPQGSTIPNMSAGTPAGGAPRQMKTMVDPYGTGAYEKGLDTAGSADYNNEVQNYLAYGQKHGGYSALMSKLQQDKHTSSFQSAVLNAWKKHGFPTQ